MDKAKVAALLAEEIRTDTELRRQLGMSEGAESGLTEEEGTEIGFTTDEGQLFFVEVEEA